MAWKMKMKDGEPRKQVVYGFPLYPGEHAPILFQLLIPHMHAYKISVFEIVDINLFH